MICTAVGGRKKESLNGLLDTMSRGGEKNRAVYSFVCSVSGVNSAMSFREKPSPKIFSIMFSVWVVTDWLFFSRWICDRLTPWRV